MHGAGLTSGYYNWGEPMTGLFRSRRYDDITYPITKFFTDAKAGTLPNVTFVEPDYGTIAEFLGTSNDYHPHGNIQVGEGYVAADLQRAAQEPAVGPHGVRRQLRRERRLLRPRRPADA